MYSNNFERDFRWYMTRRHGFNFDGVVHYCNKEGEPIIQYDKNGVNGKEAFFQWDSGGKIKSTKHPNILHTLLKVKGSCNLHIKMYAQSRAEGSLPKVLFISEICEPLKVPEWFYEAVETQKLKYIKYIQNSEKN